MLDTLLLPTQVGHQSLRVMGGLLQRLMLVRYRDMLQAIAFPLTSQPAFTIRRLLNASGQLHQCLLSIGDQHRQVEDV